MGPLLLAALPSCRLTSDSRLMTPDSLLIALHHGRTARGGASAARDTGPLRHGVRAGAPVAGDVSSRAGALPSALAAVPAPSARRGHGHRWRPRRVCRLVSPRRVPDKLLDAVPLHVDQAREVSSRQPDHPFTAVVGDARELPYEDQSADAVVLFGPLYHLTERDDRLRALAEARRVLRPDGVVLAAAISRFASLSDGLKYGLLEDPAFVQIVSRDLDEGQHRNPGDHPNYFTTRSSTTRRNWSRRSPRLVSRWQHWWRSRDQRCSFPTSTTGGGMKHDESNCSP